MHADPDRDLERAFIEREQWALEALYVRHARTFYAAALGVLQDPDEAQDCVQEVLLRLLQRPHAFSQGRGSLKAFVTVCIRNEAIGRYRAARRRPQLEDRLAKYVEDETFEPFDHLEHARLVGALKTLPEPQRRVTILAYYHHMTHREIAQAIGEPIGTVKSRLFHALRRLGQVLGGTPS
ncbi:MAG TPA: sigma-70 family RNA polymerase sigma factor [Candidatus Baltobacteraceae bacterium]|nr:sigma-70 family RNA polymerase sigma factor [Candidatus Baltobacteraceae bacterium]